MAMYAVFFKMEMMEFTASMEDGQGHSHLYQVFPVIPYLVKGRLALGQKWVDAVDMNCSFAINSQ
jgi:hypothetical protein